MAGRGVCQPVAWFIDPHSGQDGGLCKALQLACRGKPPFSAPSAAPVQRPHNTWLGMLHYVVSCVLQQNLGYIKMKT